MSVNSQHRVIRPQKGYQLEALASPADIVIGGGAAGSGKTYTLLLEFLRHIDNKKWGGVIFRRTYPQIRSEGGLWDTSKEIYPLIGAKPQETLHAWKFRSGAKLKFSHLEHDKSIFDWQGAQIPFIGFDELTHFTEKQFFYLLTRNRSTCGVKPYVRATCNPDPGSWVADLISWWIDKETGLPIPERNGVIRYFIKYGENYIWGDTRQEVIEQCDIILKPITDKSQIKPDELVKSITFVSGSVYENQKLLSVNPTYIANLLSQDNQTKSQLLDGNWKVVVSDKDLYDYYDFSNAFTNEFVQPGTKRYITADIALEGSNKLIIGVWYDNVLEDVRVMDKSDGKQVIDIIKELAKKHAVPNSNIVYDNDGVGGYVKGFVPGAVPFNNNGAALNKENYANLKTQCYYKSAEDIKDNKYRISERVATTMYSHTMTIRQRFLHELKAIKKDKTDGDKKMHIIPKSQMKLALGGESPDLMDMFMMRKYFDLSTKSKTKYSGLV